MSAGGLYAEANYFNKDTNLPVNQRVHTLKVVILNKVSNFFCADSGSSLLTSYKTHL